MQKNCANCKNSYIKDGCYLICEIDGIQNDVVENCENFEVDPDLISQLEKENKELKAKNEQLKEEINDFISDISTCGFKYDGRCPDDLDELQSSIEYLCNKFGNYKHALKDIKSIAQNLYYQSIKDPVRREKATYDIIEKVNGILEE